MISGKPIGNDVLQERALRLAEPGLAAVGIQLDSLQSLRAYVAPGMPADDVLALRDYAVQARQNELLDRLRVRSPERRLPGAPRIPLEVLATVCAEFRAQLAAGGTQQTAAAYTARKLGTTRSLPRTAQRRLFRQLRAADPTADADTLHFRMEGLIAAATEAAALKPPSICGRSAA